MLNERRKKLLLTGDSHLWGCAVEIANLWENCMKLLVCNAQSQK
jgi:hypothetical protein